MFSPPFSLKEWQSHSFNERFGNALYLSDDGETVTAKVRGALTDTGRIARTDRGNPDVCTVAVYHKTFNAEQYGNICGMCRSATVGCVACKQELALCLNKLLDPVRRRREQYEQNISRVKEFIEEGSRRANRIGQKQIRKVKNAMNITL